VLSYTLPPHAAAAGMDSEWVNCLTFGKALEAARNLMTT
jgi:hypothetical protein